MPLICYTPKTFSAAHRDIIDKANRILEEYQAQGFVLTLRQLYYQFVARGFIANTQASYNRLGAIINDARLAGKVDWNHLIDRTRNVRTIAAWSSPEEIVKTVADQYAEPIWEDQCVYIEVWIEKDAQVGNFEGVCDEWRLPLFSCRGYTSQSEMWSAARRLEQIERGFHKWVLRDGRKTSIYVPGRRTLVLHFGDHDPSGVDMTRDIQDRLHLFGADTEIRRLALEMPQIERFNPPPNPAKITDSRAASYIAVYGDESWELDSMEPAYLAGLVRSEVAAEVNQEIWDNSLDREEANRRTLEKVSRRWSDVSDFVNAK